MKKISHSEISTYLDCQKRWDLQYNKGIRFETIHTKFGSMAHKVMETREIPDESLYPDLKENFNITSWKNYFTSILDEIDDYFKDYELIHTEYRVENEFFVGVIDAVWKNKNTNKILITDYKFSNSDKGITDVFLDEQMYLYAVMYGTENGLNLDDITIGYINIPKAELNAPRVLKNGQLSKDKAQNTTRKKYLEAIHNLGLNEEDYSDILSELEGRSLVSITVSTINPEMAVRIMTNVDNVIKDMKKEYVLEKCTFQCKTCQYLQYCKYNKSIPNNETSPLI